MRLEYISHSCFILETGGKTIAFDPWITGTAYQDQWYLYPEPADISKVRNADILLISHGHEDHLHTESLKLVQKNAHIFFPFQWRKGVTEWLNHLGFSAITEAISFRTTEVDDIRITYLGYSLESVIVVECEGMVIVNINDALNSNHETAVDYLLQKIKSRWPKIDFMLSGWSGAGYFPNKVHYDGKHDEEVARIREQYFANNFCRFVQYLQPEIAVPFAPGFVLLDDENRWINNIKFPRAVLENYYQENFDKESRIHFPLFYPGDYMLDKTFYKVSPCHQNGGDETLYAQVDDHFSREIAEVNRVVYFSDEKLTLLIRKLADRMNRNRSVYPATVLSDAVFSVQLKDVLENPFLNITFSNGKFVVQRSGNKQQDDRLVIRTKASILSESLDKAWGGDLLTIGYAIDVDVFEELSLEKNLDIVCVRLISSYPVMKDDFLHHPARMVKYYLSNPSLTHLWLTQKLRLRPYVNKYPFNERDHWITFSKCDLCKVCKLPELDFASLHA